MPTPASRLLTLLELLQTQSVATGREIAERLAIDRRTVRRYVATLQELGIPVEGERGVGGGYRLRPGFRLPPLMLGDDEAVAVVLGLIAAARQGVASAEPALAKVERVLPDGLRRRAGALEAALGFTGPATGGAPVSGETVLLLADAIRRRRRVRTRYRSFAGEESDRELSPLGLVVHAGRWYLAADDHGRRDLRTFRVDRMSRLSVEARAAALPPPGFDAVAHVSRSLARVPWPWEVEALLELPLEQAARRLPETLAELAAVGGRTRLRMRVASLDWAAGLLAGLGCDFEIERPDELRASVAALAERLARLAASPDRADTLTRPGTPGRGDEEESLVTEGEPAPDFTLTSDAGETITLSELRGKPVVLYFYPKDDTPGCTTQACGVRDAYGEFERAGAVVLGVSPDSVARHVKFKQKYDLPFTLLADPEHEVAERYGVWGEKKYMGRTYMGVSRSTFVIGADGTVARVMHDVKPATHADDVLALLA